MHTVARECCYPNCEAKPSDKLDQPLCDRHLIKVYREMHDLICSTEPKRPTVRHAPRRLSTVRKETPGTVYFVRFGQRVKIGFTTNLTQRLRTVPHDEVLATIPGDQYLERRLHARFRHLHATGEWFSLRAELAEYIAAINAAAS